MMADPVLLFGVGAAKSGISWLYDYLKRHPECNLRSIKELHFFDTMELGKGDWYLRDFRRKADHLEAIIAAGDGAAPVEQLVQLAELRLYVRVLEKGDTDGYLGFLMEGLEDDDVVVGDITPSYALLSQETLGRMATLREDVRFIYIMRDPVERLWSHIRMVAWRRAPGDHVRQASRLFDSVLLGRETHIRDRGDYRATLTKLQAVVAPEKLFVCTYEELFDDDMLGRICGFLGIAPIPGNRGPVHRGVSVAMTELQRKRAAAWLRPQYEYVASELGALPSAWQASLAEI